MNQKLVKRDDAGEMVATMLMSAILALMILRIWLELTGYPRVGRGIWHISHVLEGGLAMTLGQIIGLVWHGDRARKWSAIFFGVGFGWFIDEIGKFITTDYDYFFQPAFSLIYIVFILLFLVYWVLEREIPQDPRSLTYHVLNQMEDVADNNLSKTEKAKVVRNLKIIQESGTKSNRLLARQLMEIVLKSETRERTPGWVEYNWKRLSRIWYSVFKVKLFQYLLMILAAVFVGGAIADTVNLLARFNNKELFDYWIQGKELFSRADINMFTFKTVADGLTSLLFLGGLFWLSKRKKLRGINFFQYGLLVNIFFSSVFKFYFEQLSGVVGVISSVLIFLGLSRLKKDGFTGK
jgi:hypothetical protein